MILHLSQDGATPAVLASKAGHREIADLIAAGGSPAGRHALPTQAPARRHEDSTTFTYDQLRVGTPQKDLKVSFRWLACGVGDRQQAIACLKLHALPYHSVTQQAR